MLAYLVGFLVTLGRAQLFTANMVTPVTVVLSHLSSATNLLRLWAVAAVVVHGHLLQAGVMEVLLGESL